MNLSNAKILTHFSIQKGAESLAGDALFRKKSSRYARDKRTQLLGPSLHTGQPSHFAQKLPL